jgi:hypothetical protein
LQEAAFEPFDTKGLVYRRTTGTFIYTIRYLLSLDSQGSYTTSGFLTGARLARILEPESFDRIFAIAFMTKDRYSRIVTGAMIDGLLQTARR